MIVSRTTPVHYQRAITTADVAVFVTAIAIMAVIMFCGVYTLRTLNVSASNKQIIPTQKSAQTLIPQRYIAYRVYCREITDDVNKPCETLTNILNAIEPATFSIIGLDNGDVMVITDLKQGKRMLREEQNENH